MTKKDKAFKRFKEDARVAKQLVKEFGKDIELIAMILGRSKTYVLRCLEY